MPSLPASLGTVPPGSDVHMMPVTTGRRTVLPVPMDHRDLLADRVSTRPLVRW